MSALGRAAYSLTGGCIECAGSGCAAGWMDTPCATCYDGHDKRLTLRQRHTKRGRVELIARRERQRRLGRD
jgi:hypothetical protein